jgi:glucan 1,3-beta-glucosidase
MQIGYYHLCKVDPSVLHHTDFEGLHDVFEGAWNRITNAITIAHRFGIGVLLGAYPMLPAITLVY